MPRPSRQPVTDDIAVGKDSIDPLFEPPFGRSTFYKKVAQGVVVKCPAGDGFYLLNATRVRLGLPPVEPAKFRAEYRRQDRVAFPVQKRLAVVAMTALVPELQKLYPLSFFPRWLTDPEIDRVIEIRDKMAPELAKMGTLAERLFFAGGVIWSLDLAGEEPR